MFQLLTSSLVTLALARSMGIVLFQGSFDNIFGHLNLMVNMGEDTMSLPIMSPIRTEDVSERMAPETVPSEKGVREEVEVVAGKDIAEEVVSIRICYYPSSKPIGIVLRH